jgi:hypothetical protein
MKLLENRRKFLSVLSSTLAWLLMPVSAQIINPAGRKRDKQGRQNGQGRGEAKDYALPTELATFNLLSLVLGRVSDRSVTVSTLAKEPMEGFFEYGKAHGNYEYKTKLFTMAAGKPIEAIFDNLEPNTEYAYRLQFRKVGQSAFQARAECGFHTQRTAGSNFMFAIQGDSHPERPQMSEPNLYARTLQNVARSKPDFYICMGDDFSVAPIHEVSYESVAERYILQRPFLGLVAQSSPIFLLNGNHEQASLFNFNQTDERHAVAVHAQVARNQFYPTPAPDKFYSGDSETLPSVGLRKDYCAWTWGDALFVILDNYWHSPAQVDSGFREHDSGGGKGARGHDRDWWALTLGNAQYNWFRRTLEQSKSKYKFVFAHHVLGSGRGGVEECDLYEWGGRNKRGDWEFAQKRPGWELPIHQLMVKYGVTIFFQGHDHLFCKQERDGIIYQEVPMPADQGYMTYNSDRYESGVKLPNSGHLRVCVSPENVKVEYVRSFLPKDETAQNKTGDISHSYTIKARSAHD